MNTTTLQSAKAYGSNPQNQTVSSYGYTIGVCVAVVITISIFTYISYFVRRMNHNVDVHLNRVTIVANHSSIVTIHQDGLGEDVLASYPKCTYMQPEPNKGDSTASACCICLADYKEKDLLRLLPDCGHMFHLKCVDPWLMLHATCPICRNSPSTTPEPAIQMQIYE